MRLVRRRQPLRPIARESAERYGPGEAPPAHHPAREGDFILTHGDDWIDTLIRFGQALRFRGADAKYAYWNHAALIIGPAGELVEATGSGVVQDNLSKYQPREYHLIRINASEEDRQEVAAFGRWCTGEEYGYLTIVSVALNLLSGTKFAFMIEGQEICSGLVARAQERTHAIFNRDPAHVMPADLAKYYQVV
jgi:uncharacterized protein YycO